MEYQSRNTQSNSLILHPHWKVGRNKFQCFAVVVLFAGTAELTKVKIGESLAALSLLVSFFGSDATSFAVFSVRTPQLVVASR